MTFIGASLTSPTIWDHRAVGTGPAGPATAGPILQANENAQLNFTVTNLQLHYFEFRQEFN